MPWRIPKSSVCSLTILAFIPYLCDKDILIKLDYPNSLVLWIKWKFLAILWVVIPLKVWTLMYEWSMERIRELSNPVSRVGSKIGTFWLTFADAACWKFRVSLRAVDLGINLTSDILPSWFVSYFYLTFQFHYLFNEVKMC